MSFSRYSTMLTYNIGVSVTNNNSEQPLQGEVILWLQVVSRGSCFVAQRLRSVKLTSREELLASHGKHGIGCKLADLADLHPSLSVHNAVSDWTDLSKTLKRKRKLENRREKQNKACLLTTAHAGRTSVDESEAIAEALATSRCSHET